MRWYAIRSKPNREEALWTEIDARGFQSFYPHVRVKPVNPRSRTIRPYFPGYLFVKASLADVGQSVFAWLPYSLGLVSFGGEPAEVAEGLIQALRKHLEDIKAESAEPLRGLNPGDPVLIQDGPFAGYEAIFDARVGGEERVRVLLNLLKMQQIKVELPAGQIQPIKRH